MICPSCASDTSKVSLFENGKWQCRFCPDKYTPRPILDFKTGSFANSSTGKMTAAHRDHIERRALAADGSVYQDRGRKSFTLR